VGCIGADGGLCVCGLTGSVAGGAEAGGCCSGVAPEGARPGSGRGWPCGRPGSDGLGVAVGGLVAAGRLVDGSLLVEGSRVGAGGAPFCSRGGVTAPAGGALG